MTTDQTTYRLASLPVEDPGQPYAAPALPATEVSWRFSGYAFHLNEDGLHLRVDRTLEQPEVLELIERYQRIHGQIVATRQVDAPRPPSPDEIKAMGYVDALRRSSKVALDAVTAALSEGNL